MNKTNARTRDPFCRLEVLFSLSSEGKKPLSTHVAMCVHYTTVDDNNGLVRSEK